MEVCELDDEGVKAFMGVYLREKQEKEKAGGERVEVEPDFAELQRKGLLAERGVGRNPYWLRMLVLSGLRTRNRGALFLNFARELLRREIEVKPEERKRKPEWAAVPLEVEMEALAELALAMNRERQVGLEGEENWQRGRQIIKATLGDRRESPDDVLGEAEAATLIRQRYKERIEFTHQLVQEFFATYALRRENRWEEAIAHCEDSWWWETLFLLGGLTVALEAGGSPQMWAALTRQVLGDARNDMRLFVAIGLLRSIEVPEATVSREVLEAFVASVDERLTPEQQRATRELERILGDEAIEIFETMFHDPASPLKARGAALLCSVGSRRVMESLLATLRNPEERQAAFQALASIGALAVEPLIVALKDANWDVRRQAAEALGQIGDARAVEPLIAALKDANEMVRRQAAEALGKIGDARAVEPLVTALKESDAIVRREATKALGKIGDARAVQPFIAALKDADAIVRQRAAEALGNIGDARAVEPLIAALKDVDESVRQRAAEALGKIGDARAVEPLIAALKDANWDARWKAAKALGQIGQPAIESLIVALKDANWDARARAAAALGNIGDARAVEPLIAALKDANWDARAVAAEALGQIGNARAVEPLIVALEDADGGVRRRAAEALGQIGDTRAVEPLIVALEDTDGGVRRRVAEALGQIGQPAVEPLIVALKDANWDARAVAAEALGQVGDARAVEPLIAALKDANWDAHAVAAEALGKIGDARAVEPLIAALQDANWNARGGAAWALGQIGDALAVKPLIAALKDAAVNVRREAAKALGKIGDARALPELERVGREYKAETPRGSVADEAKKAAENIRRRLRAS
jgi:HEAT repeat protein